MSEIVMSFKDASNTVKLVNNEIRTGLVGLERESGEITDAIFAGENVLLQGTPGVGKTAIVERAGKVISKDTNDSNDYPVYSRFQGTKDSLPADVVGGRIYDQERKAFAIAKGPIFANIFLYDELNRAPEETQAAIHTATDEGKVIIAGKVLHLPKPFMTFGTINEHEHGQGTNPIPDALLSRFGVAVNYSKPTEEDLIEATTNRLKGVHRNEPKPIISTKELFRLQRTIESIAVTPEAIRYQARALIALANLDNVDSLAEGYRANEALLKVAQANAVRNDDVQVTPDHIKTVFPYVVTHLVKSVDYDPSLKLKQKAVSEALSAADKIA